LQRRLAACNQTEAATEVKLGDAITLTFNWQVWLCYNLPVPLRVCGYVCMRTCICVHVPASVHACMRSILLNKLLFFTLLRREKICSRYVPGYIYIYTHAQGSKYIYIYIYIHTRTHTRTPYTHTHISLLFSFTTAIICYI
jgi:hypothetical protein